MPNIRDHLSLHVLAFLLFSSPIFSKICDPSPLILSMGPCNITSSDPTVPTIYSWGGKVTVGNGQEICMCPGTVMNSSTLMMEQVCQGDNQLILDSKEKMSPAQCASRRGGFVKSSSFPNATAAEASQIQDLNPDWDEIQRTDPFSFLVDPVFHIFAGPENDISTTAVGIQNGQNHTAAALSLGRSSAILDVLFSASRIFSHSFGLFVGSTSIEHPDDGHLFLGGYDANAIDGQLFEYSMDYPKYVNNRVCDLQVSLDELVLRAPGQNDTSLIGISQGKYVCLELYDNLFRMPSSVTDQIKNFLVKTLDTQPLPLPADPNIYVNEPGIVFNANDTKDIEWSLVFTLNRNFTVSVPSYEVFRPFRSLATNGSFVVRNDLRELQMFHEETNLPLDAVVLGKILLSQMYIFANYDTGKLGLAHIKPPGERSQVVNAHIVYQDQDEQCDPQERGLSGTTIGLIIVGIALALLILAILWGGWWLHRRGFLIFARQQQTLDKGRSGEQTIPVPAAPSAGDGQPAELRGKMMTTTSGTPNVAHESQTPATKERQLSEVIGSPVSQPISNPEDWIQTSISAEANGCQASEILGSPVSPKSMGPPDLPEP